MAEKRLTKELAEQFLAEGWSVKLTEFTELDDDAAESLSRYRSPLSLKGLTSLSDSPVHLRLRLKMGESLNGLTSLSDAAAESLSKHEGDLLLKLKNLPASAAEILRQHPSLRDK